MKGQKLGAVPNAGLSDQTLLMATLEFKELLRHETIVLQVEVTTIGHAFEFISILNKLKLLYKHHHLLWQQIVAGCLQCSLNLL